MGSAESKPRATEGGDNRVIGRAVGITGGGPLKRGAGPRIPTNAVRSSLADQGFLEVCSPDGHAAALASDAQDRFARPGPSRCRRPSSRARLAGALCSCCLVSWRHLPPAPGAGLLLRLAAGSPGARSLGEPARNVRACIRACARARRRL
jgi:hypothetical protein